MSGLTSAATRVLAFSLILVECAVCRSAETGGASTPLVSQVKHDPLEPKSGQPVTITAALGPADGAASTNQGWRATMHLQVVEPGKYLRKADAAYTNSWRLVPMQDDGRDGDKRSRDGIFTAVVPPETQLHRRLIRYFVTFTNAAGHSVRMPQATNTSPNFAYFVYDGLPGWTGASQPGKTPALKFSSEFMKTLRAYHLIARGDDVVRSQWDGAFDKKPFFGTLVYDGRVYDHIQYRNRGKASTHVAGKNKWGFTFNREQEFQARDLWGRLYSNPWRGLSMNACASPWAQVNRGMAGMDEAVSFRAYQLAGVPSSDTHWIQFRVIASATEFSTNNQYEGDLWGLYHVVQPPDGAFLSSHHFPDGNVYSPEDGIKHRAKGMPESDVDWQKFAQASSRGQPELWWRTNVHLPRYYSLHALNRVLANIDLRHGANHYLYRDPEGRWSVVPWDLDMMFIPKTHWPGVVDQTRCLDIPRLKLEYQNRAREVLDLFCADAAPNGGQIGQLVDELARVLVPAGHERSWPELDRAMWNYHPRNTMKGQFYVNPFHDGRMGGNWRRTLASPDFAGFCKYIVEFCTDSRPTKNYVPNDGDQRGYGFGFLAWESRDEKIPQRPVVRRKESEGGVNELLFEISPFAPPPRITNAFASIQWRVGEISAPGLEGYEAGAPRRHEIEEFWRSPEMTTPATEFRLPSGIFKKGKTYRVRARYKDNTGRWSHWSGAVQFVGR